MQHRFLEQACSRREVCFTFDAVLCSTTVWARRQKKTTAHTFFKFNADDDVSKCIYANVLFCFFYLVRSFFSAGAEFFGVVSSAMRSEDPSVYYQLCAGFMGRPWRELWPRKAAKTGSISRGTNFEKSGRGVGTFIFVCGAFLSSTLTGSLRYTTSA